RGFQVQLVARHQQHLGAEAQQLARAGEADALAGTGDQRHLAVQPPAVRIHAMPPFRCVPGGHGMRRRRATHKMEATTKDCEVGMLQAAWAALLLVGAAVAAPAEPCTDQRGFDRGRAGLARAEQCAAEDYASAWRLGESLRTLAAERDALAAGQAGRDPAARNAAARRIRQLEVDIEAIRGLLQLRRIVEQGPVPE